MAQRPRLESVPGLSPFHSQPQQEGERWLHLCARSLLALFFVAGAKCDKFYAGAFWCEVLSAGIGVSAANSFISRSLAGREPRSKGQRFIHQNSLPLTPQTTWEPAILSAPLPAPQALGNTTYAQPTLAPNARGRRWLNNPADTRGCSVVTSAAFVTVGYFSEPRRGKERSSRV